MFRVRSWPGVDWSILTVKMSEGKHPPPHDPLLASVRTLGDALVRFDDAASKVLGIGRTDLRALFVLEDGAATAGHIGERLDLTSGSVTALIDRLVAAGYVIRKTDERDRRVVHVELTTATYRAIARVYAPAGRAVIGVAGSLPDDQVAAVADTLNAVASLLDGLRRGLVEDRSSGATPAALGPPRSPTAREPRRRRTRWNSRNSGRPARLVSG